MPEEEVAWKGYEPKSPEALAAAKAYVPPPAIIAEAPDITVEEVGREAPPPPTEEAMPTPVIEEYPEVAPIPVEKPAVVGLEPVIPQPPFRMPFGATNFVKDAQDRVVEYTIGGEVHFTPSNVNWYEGGFTSEKQHVAWQKGLAQPDVPMPSELGQDTPIGKITLVPRDQAVALSELTGEEQFKAFQGAGVIPYGSRFVPDKVEGWKGKDWVYFTPEQVKEQRAYFLTDRLQYKIALDAFIEKLPEAYKGAYTKGGVEGLRTYARKETLAFETSLPYLPQEAQDAYKEGGFEAYDRWRGQWETENLFIDDYAIPIAVWNSLPSKYQTTALNDGIPALSSQLEKDRQEYEREKAKQDTALNTLTAMGYRTTREEYPVGLAPFELYEAEEGVYDVWKYLQDNPKPQSVALLTNARYSQETIVAAQEYVNEVQKAITAMDEAVSPEAMKRVTIDFGEVDHLALNRAVRALDIPMVSASGAVTWRGLSQSDKEGVITEYTNDLARRNIFAGISADLIELKEGIKDRILKSTAPITPEGLRGGVRSVMGIANEALFFFPVIATGIAEVVTEDIKQLPDYTKIRLEAEWVNPRTGKVISNEEYEALGDSIEIDDYVLTTESADKLPVVRLPKQFAVGTAQLFAEGVKKIPIGGYEAGAGLAIVGLMTLPFAPKLARFKPWGKVRVPIDIKADLQASWASKQFIADALKAIDRVNDAIVRQDAVAIRASAGELRRMAEAETLLEKGIKSRLLETAKDVTANADALVQLQARTIPITEATVWTGFRVGSRPLLGVSKGRPVIGAKGIEFPPLERWKLPKEVEGAPFEPRTGLETSVLVNRTALEKAGMTKPDAAKLVSDIEVTLGNVRQFYGKKSPNMNADLLAKPIDTFSQKGVEAILEYVIQNRHIVDRVFGSSTIRPQFAPEALAEWQAKYGRLPGDIDIMLKNVTAEQASAFTKGLVEYIKRRSGEQPWIDPSQPMLIKNFSRSTLAKRHAIDIHYPGEPLIEGQITPSQFADMVYGMKKTSPTVKANVQGIGEIDIARLSETGIGKTEQVLGWRVEPATGKVILKTEAHRLKDYVDLYEIIKTYNGEKAANKWASDLGITDILKEFELRNQGFEALYKADRILDEIKPDSSATTIEASKLKVVDELFNFKEQPAVKGIFNDIIESLRAKELLPKVRTNIRAILKDWQPKGIEWAWEFRPSPDASVRAIGYYAPIVSITDVGLLSASRSVPVGVTYEGQLISAPSKISVPSESISLIPTPPPSVPPTEPPSIPPSEIVSEPPSEIVSEPPSIPPSEPISIPPSEVVSEIPSEIPSEPPSVPPSVPPSEIPSEPPSEIVSEPPYVPPSEPPYVPPSEPPYVPPSEPPSVPPSEPPSVPPSEPYYPPITLPPIEPPPPIKIPPPIMWKSEIPDEWRATGVPAGTITWRQGMKWQVLPPPYRDEDMMSLDHPLPGTTKFAVGKGSARKTLQILGGRPPMDADVDMGWASIHISAKDGKMDIRFGGGQEAAEDRWAMEREAMGELEREAYEGIPAGLMETSRIPRTRARLPLEDVREIYPPEEAIEEPLSETELLLQQIERGQARREASRTNVPRIGNRYYEEDMTYVPAHYRRRNSTPLVEESGIKLQPKYYLGRKLRSTLAGTGV